MHGDRELAAWSPGQEFLGSHLVCGQSDGCDLLPRSVSDRANGRSHLRRDPEFYSIVAGESGEGWRCITTVMRQMRVMVMS